MAKRKFTDTEELDIIKSYVSGESTSDIARRIGSFGPTIISMLKRHNVDRRTNSDSHRFYSLDQTCFDNIDNEHSAYWLGFIFADGTISKNRNQLSVTLQNRDRLHLQRLADFMGTNKPVGDHRQIYKGQIHISASLSVRSWPIANRLKELGIRAGRPNPSRSFMFLPENLKRHWIRGWFDGDGSVFIPTSQPNQIKIMFLGDDSLLETVTKWMEMNFKIDSPSIHQVRTKKVYSARYGDRQRCERIYNLMYNEASIFLGRKYEVFRNYFGE